MHDKNILSLKEKILEILDNMTEIIKEKTYYEISLPMLLDNSYQIVIFLQKINNNEYLLYNNLYIPIEMSLKEHLTSKKIENFGENILKNSSEFKEIKDALKKFGINISKITLDYKTNNKNKLEEEILIYADFVKKYYNTIYTCCLERYGKKSEKKDGYYKNFETVIETYTQKNKFNKLNREGLSNVPVYENNKKLVTTSKDPDSLTKFYIDLEDILASNTYVGGVLLYKGKIKSESIKLLEKKYSKKKFKIIMFSNNNKENLKEIIDSEFFNGEI